MNSRHTLNPAWPKVLGLCALAVAVLAGISRNLFFGTSLPQGINLTVNFNVVQTSQTRTIVMLWLARAHGWTRRSCNGNQRVRQIRLRYSEGFTHQQIHHIGCMLHPYTVKDGAMCLAEREVIFVGDSVTRKLFFQFVHLLDPSLPTAPPDDTQKHQSHSFLTKADTRISFYWDPFLNGSYTESILSESMARNSTYIPRPPAMLVLGSGLWYLRYATTSGGISAWESNVDHLFKSFARTQTPISDSIILLPVEEVVISKLSPERASTMHPSDIDAMNSDLFHRIHPPSPSFSLGFAHHRSTIRLPLVFNEMLDSTQTEDGLHYSDSLVKIQANILLNLRCNNELPKQYPFSKTCCNAYPMPHIAHAVVIWILVLSIPLMGYMVSAGGMSRFLKVTLMLLC